MWRVIFGRIQRQLYAARVILDNMVGSVRARSTQEASFLYDMYLDDENLEAFMASVDVKGVFPNTQHRLVEEVWRQLGLPYGDFVGKYLRTRRYTVATGKGCTEWVTQDGGVRQGGEEGPFLYMPAMFPLMSWIAREYPQLARAPHMSPTQAYVDDAVPMARDEKAQQVVQGLMQRYQRDNHLVWSADKSAVLRRGGEGGMALDVGDGVAWPERAEEAVVLGYVQAMEAEGVKLPEKLPRGFMPMLMVLLNHPPSVQTTLYYLRAVLNAAIGYQGMHLPYWRGQLEEVEGDMWRLIRDMRGEPWRYRGVCCGRRRPTMGRGLPRRGRRTGHIPPERWAGRATIRRRWCDGCAITRSRRCRRRRTCAHAMCATGQDGWRRGRRSACCASYRRCCRERSTR